MKRSIFLLPLALLVAACAGRTDSLNPPLAHQVAATYGARQWHRVERIDFTFHARVGDREVERSWRWWPKAHVATENPDTPDAATFPTRGPAPEFEAHHRRFVNDIYWLVFPLRMITDDGVTIENAGRESLATEREGVQRLVVTYGDDGYTPGDVYELLVNDENRVRAWIYRRGGAAEPTRIAAWEDHARIGPLLVAHDHPGKDGFRVWLTDVRVETIDGKVHAR